MSKKQRAPAPKAPAQRKPEQKQRATDQRIRRTRSRLGAALMTLIQEKPIDAITVQEVLDRASVGRSTFYLHFRDKDDLFFTNLEDFLEMTSTLLSRRQEKSLRVAPVEEMFAHIADAKELYRALVVSGRIHEFFELAEGFFARSIEQRLKDSGRLPKMPQRELTARSFALAGSLMSLLHWWLDRGAREPARSMDELFHAMVWKGIQ